MLRVLILTSLLAATASAQTTWYVDVAGTPPGSGTLGSPYTSIDYALQQPATVSGDTVLVAPGTYVENVTFPGRGVSLISTNGAAVTTIDGGRTGSVVSLLSTDGTAMLLKGFTISGGSGTSPSGTASDEQGGGIFAAGCIAKVRECIVEDNIAFEGGGVYATNSDFDMRTSTVRNNMTSGFSCTGGGLMFSGGTAKLRRCIIQFNAAGTVLVPGKGGGIYAAGPLSVRRCSIADNVGELAGGGIYGGDEVAGSRVFRNRAQLGGGLYGTTLVFQSSIQNNDADSSSGSGHLGGGIFGPTDVFDCYIAGNLSYGQGGAAYNATLVRCTIEYNETRDGDGTVNFAQGGGAMSCSLTDCSLFDNSANGMFAGMGGGASQSTLNGCTLAGNSSQALSGPLNAAGGGTNESTLIDCEVLGNSTTGFGGGVHGGSTLSTAIIGNTATWGGGAANASLNRTTVFDNTATAGADGVHIEFFASNTLLDSIVWANGTSEIQVEAGGTLGVTYTDVSGGWPGTGNTRANPMFWNPATGDVHLQAGSPCIDAGDPASALDPDGSRADMGAYPFDPSYPD